MAGPILVALALGAAMLLRGKVHFGHIYGLGVFGCCSLWLVMTLMSHKGVDIYQVSARARARAHTHTHTRARACVHACVHARTHTRPSFCLRAYTCPALCAPACRRAARRASRSREAHGRKPFQSIVACYLCIFFCCRCMPFSMFFPAC